MRLSEAYQELGLSEGVSQEEAKKAYRKLASTWHPDKNKDPEAESKLKRINEAYEVVKSGKSNDRNGSFRHQVVRQNNVELNISISFKDSILGCKREVKYGRQSKCISCNGNGETQLNNGCKKCGGAGRNTIKQNGMIFIQTCSECRGQAEMQECTACRGECILHTDVAVNISVPPGVPDQSVLRLQGMGNYAGSFMGFSDQYTDAFCHIAVDSEPDLQLDGNNVVSHLTLPLLEAIKGGSYSIKTIFGTKQISIPPLSRHKEEVAIPHHGVAGSGDQRVVLEVQYPADTKLIIQALEAN